MKVKSEKGSIAIFVLVALLFYAAFLLLLYSNNLNKVQTIEEKTEILKKIYEKNVNEDSINDIYNRKMTQEMTIEKYIKDGLVLHFDGIYNTKNGHSQDTTIWEDLSGHNNDGTLISFNNTEESGWKENALIFDGADDGVYLENKLENLLKDDYTIEVIINFKESNTRDIIIGNYSSANSTNFENWRNGFRIYYNHDQYNNSNCYPLRNWSKSIFKHCCS